MIFLAKAVNDGMQKEQTSQNMSIEDDLDTLQSTYDFLIENDCIAEDNQAMEDDVHCVSLFYLLHI